MIQSMTGYGKSTAEFSDKKIIVEIKSLNSKQFDLFTRISGICREKESVIRSELSQQLIRGKIDFSLLAENGSTETSAQIDPLIFESYYRQIENISQKLNLALPNNWFSTILRLPDVLKSESKELSENDRQTINRAISEAVDRLIDFRKQEGRMLEELMEQKINNIAELRIELEQYEPERVEKIRGRIVEALEKIENFDYDKNRFEQEMIFYIEKLDINEEKARLDNHLHYFLETMRNDMYGQGKKLGFIAQEIGREINTLGSKSNHAEMQKIVVRMKDELEQIKEQILNVL